uniref:Uncharacterized protein n=1 Tax=Siphoviridae sp. ct86u1 TaxID=2827789 RepID=A0A8S5T5N8_9CAUD|nr:MAG TPA: hypothetical protein [Siphoviridae sp. ct86u1]
MNALSGTEAKRFLLGLAAFPSVLGDFPFRGLRARCAKFDARLEGRFQRVLEAPHRRVVEVEAVGVAGLQGFDAEMLLGDECEDGVDLAHGVFLSGLVGVT